MSCTQDYTRTGTYFMAIMDNKQDFEGRTVMDVGAGSGVLSLFSAQAGARKVCKRDQCSGMHVRTPGTPWLSSEFSLASQVSEGGVMGPGSEILRFQVGRPVPWEMESKQGGDHCTPDQ